MCKVDKLNKELFLLATEWEEVDTLDRHRSAKSVVESATPASLHAPLNTVIWQKKAGLLVD